LEKEHKFLHLDKGVHHHLGGNRRNNQIAPMFCCIQGNCIHNFSPRFHLDTNKHMNSKQMRKFLHCNTKGFLHFGKYTNSFHKWFRCNKGLCNCKMLTHWTGHNTHHWCYYSTHILVLVYRKRLIPQNKSVRNTQSNNCICKSWEGLHN